MCDTHNIVSFLIVWLIVFICTFTAVCIRTNQFQDEAVRVGHAKYTVDNEANVKFEWLATQTVELSKNNEK